MQFCIANKTMIVINKMNYAYWKKKLFRHNEIRAEKVFVSSFGGYFGIWLVGCVPGDQDTWLSDLHIWLNK